MQRVLLERTGVPDELHHGIYAIAKRWQSLRLSMLVGEWMAQQQHVIELAGQ
jgi:hypothetical protein